MRKAISLLNRIRAALICFLSGVLLTGSCYAQSVAFLSEKVSLTRSGYTVYDLCNAIQKQLDVSVSYNSSKIKSNKKIIIKNKTPDLKSLLVMLKKEYGIDSKMAGNHIILLPGADYGKVPEKKEKARKPKKKKAKQKKVVQPADEIVPETLQQYAGENVAAESMPVMVSSLDSLGGADLSAGGGGVAGGGSGNVNYETESKTGKQNRALLNNLIANINIYTDQPHYFNVGAQLGYKYAYVSIAYSFHATATHRRLGGGVTFPVTEKMNLGLSGSYGTFNSGINYFGRVITADSVDSGVVVFDTVTYSGLLNARSSLVKIGLSIDYKVTPWLYVFVSPCFNTMRTGFSDDNGAQSPRSVLPVPVSIRREDFDVLKTGINLSNDFNENSASFRKNWGSIQAGIRINFAGL